MPTRLERRYDTRTSHFITCSCYQPRPLLDDDRIKRIFLRVLEETRRDYDFCVYGYVLMPEHFHLLISKPEIKDVGTALQVLKQRVSHDAHKILDPTLCTQKKGAKDGAPKASSPTLFQEKEKDGKPHPFASRKDGAPTFLGPREIEWGDLEYRKPWHFWQRRFYDFNVRTNRMLAEKLKYIHRNPVIRGLVTRPEDWIWSSFRHYATGEIGPVEIESGWTALRREREVHVMKLPPGRYLHPTLFQNPEKDGAPGPPPGFKKYSSRGEPYVRASEAGHCAHLHNVLRAVLLEAAFVGLE